ncbi:efflux RND transporter periplasmic adaptor subunit [Desulfococcaceae bacterium HSG7]|nr:efflux RND transporter periplasmic adaptor subunit [Desulfococcaceae bacterium HSG7]
MKKSVKDSHTAEASGKMEKVEIPVKKRKKNSFLPWSFTFLIVIATVLVIGYGSVKEVAEPVVPAKKLTNVEVMTVKTEEFIESLTLPAIIKADRVATLKPEFTGILERWFFKEGAQVEMNAVIAEIDTESLRLNKEELEAALKSASQNVTLGNIRKESAEVSLTNIRKNTKLEEIALDSAKSEHKLAKKQFGRIRKLSKQKLSTPSQLDDAQNTLTQSELSVFRAQQNLISARLRIQLAELAIKEAKTSIELAEAKIAELEASINLLEYKIGKGKLRAPFSGRLEEHLVQPGEMVSPGDPLANIYDLKFLRVTINVPDRYVAFLDSANEGTKLFIKMSMPGAQQRIRAKLIIPGLPKLTGGTESGIELDAQIARIAQSSDSESNTFRVELRLPNPKGALKHGIIVRSKIEYLYYPDAVIIPVKAIQVTDTGPRVLVAEKTDDAQVVRTREIEPISIYGSNLLIRSGLTRGERLVVAGWKGLVGGEKVNILMEDGNFIKPATGKKEEDK